MASPLSEDKGRLVLDIYSHFRGEPGHALRANNFLAVAARRHIKVADLQDGIDYATRQGWIEDGPNGSLRLTEAGFARMRVS